MYNWVAFGITSAMEHIFQINRILIVDPPHSQPISPFYVEIISALERVYNFVHTGNSKVLIRSVMDALWFSQGIKIDGFPAFHPELRALLNIDTDLPHHETPLLGLQRIWPAKPDGSPAEASKCGQMHTYGKVHWDVSIATLNYKHPVSSSFPSGTWIISAWSMLSNTSHQRTHAKTSSHGSSLVRMNDSQGL